MSKEKEKSKTLMDQILSACKEKNAKGRRRHIKRGRGKLRHLVTS